MNADEILMASFVANMIAKGADGDDAYGIPTLEPFSIADMRVVSPNPIIDMTMCNVLFTGISKLNIINLKGYEEGVLSEHYKIDIYFEKLPINFNYGGINEGETANLIGLQSAGVGSFDCGGVLLHITYDTTKIHRDGNVYMQMRNFDLSFETTSCTSCFGGANSFFITSYFNLNWKPMLDIVRPQVYLALKKDLEPILNNVFARTPLSMILGRQVN